MGQSQSDSQLLADRDERVSDAHREPFRGKVTVFIRYTSGYEAAEGGDFTVTDEQFRTLLCELRKVLTTVLLLGTQLHVYWFSHTMLP